MQVCDLHRTPYNAASDAQRAAVAALQAGGGEEVLFLVEHPHVITKGRNATTDSLLASPALLGQRGVQLVDTDRGGDATYHGPGQLVGYPILLLEEGRRDIRRFVHDLEEVLILTLDAHGISARRDEVHRGVWVDERKIASVGIRIARWVTSHGFALNIDTDLSFFSLIHPCGIHGCEMTSMTRELGHPVDMDSVKDTFVQHFSDVYQRSVVWRPMAEGARQYG